jgi:hypothetical protein
MWRTEHEEKLREGSGKRARMEEGP